MSGAGTAPFYVFLVLCPAGAGMTRIMHMPTSNQSLEKSEGRRRKGGSQGEPRKMLRPWGGYWAGGDATGSGHPASWRQRQGRRWGLWTNSGKWNLDSRLDRHATERFWVKGTQGHCGTREDQLRAGTQGWVGWRTMNRGARSRTRACSPTLAAGPGEGAGSGGTRRA